MVAACWLNSGCMQNVVESSFASDFECREGVATENPDAPGRFVVEGCGRRATYQCVSSTCVLQTASSSSDDSATTARRAPSAIKEGIEVKDKDEGAVMVLSLSLENRALLRITASPDKRSDLVQLKFMRSVDNDDDGECDIDWMLNGQLIQLPKPVATLKENVVSYRIQIGRELINEFSAAGKIAMRACRDRYLFAPDQVAKVRDFMDRFKEEMAWRAKPRQGTTGGMLPPSGGWPEWKQTGAPAAAVVGPTLDGSTLFKKLSVSVFQLEATLAQGTSQGSAVAVTTSELLTNCHVVEGAIKLVLRQGKNQFPALVVRSDPATDRCVIAAAGTTLQPVAGVRSFDSLEVGEPVYTLGSPVGLELTLGSGLISGRREEDGRHFVQTTAPISPGSSGGGLFDARGNLVGVTTLV